MNLMRCSNGHYYDADKFGQCPHCVQMQKFEVTRTVPMNIDLGPDANQTVDMSIPQIPDPVVPTPNQGGDQALIDEISRLTENDAISLEDNRDVTVGYYSNLIGREPVVGFLVCTKGAYFGDSFSLKNGRNFVGRASNMDVVLDMDPSVSRDRHAIIIYEPRSRTFIAQPGESREMFYINDKVVLGNEVLKGYDRISLGSTELMLIPCCGPEFCWEDEKKG